MVSLALQKYDILTLLIVQIQNSAGDLQIPAREGHSDCKHTVEQSLFGDWFATMGVSPGNTKLLRFPEGCGPFHIHILALILQTSVETAESPRVQIEIHEMCLEWY